MADTGKQSPLGINVQGSLLQNIGFRINPVAESYMGSSKVNSSYTPGRLVNETNLLYITYAIAAGYIKYSQGLLTSTTYNNLISIGSNTIPALGNSKPPTYIKIDPSDMWAGVIENTASSQTLANGPATTGYALTGTTGQGQSASWLPYDTTNTNASVTQWGYIRLHALQAWNEYNFNGGNGLTANANASPTYNNFCGSFSQIDSFIAQLNPAIFAVEDSKTFMKGTFSTMNDLMTGDITGVSLSTKEFGADLMYLGKAINLEYIDTFGKPSTLLKTLYESYAVTQELLIALLAAEVPQETIDQIGLGEVDDVSVEVEQKIYGAFLIIVEDDLQQVLIPLNCSTPNLTSLADLLNVRKLFPNSYNTLTVPLYNIEPSPNNSKTYYFIYSEDGVNSQLTDPSVAERVGNLNPIQPPPVVEETTQTSITEVNIQPEPVGFNSYLINILPNDMALAAGAFSYSMSQIKNIKQQDITKFSQIVYSIEGNFGLPLTNGSDIPTDITLAQDSQNILALGSGPYGSYTMSDFYGCMSGLPYPWTDLYNGISSLQTNTLTSVSQKIYLAATWGGATVTVQYSTAIGPLYTVTGVTLTDGGGGYGINGAVAPTITISGGSGATAVATIGTDITSVAGALILAGSFVIGVSYVIAFVGTTNFVAIGASSNTIGVVFTATGAGSGTGTAYNSAVVNNSNFGKVISVSLTSAGVATGTIPTITIQCPPNVYNGNTNTASGTTFSPTMDGVLQDYIDDANSEISSILSSNPEKSKWVNTNYNQLGRQLLTEQRARYIAVPPVDIDSGNRNSQLFPYPGEITIFVDSIPTYAQNTLPHMQAQTLEAISNFTLTGGQSVVGMMREARNDARLTTVGIPIDNNLSPNLAGISEVCNTVLALNNTITKALENQGIVTETVPISPTESITRTWTAPSWPINIDSNGNTIIPISPFAYDVNNGIVVGTGDVANGTTQTLLSLDTTTCGVTSVATQIQTGPYVVIADLQNNTNVRINNFQTTNTISNNFINTANNEVANLELRTGNSVFINTNNFQNIVNIVANITDVPLTPDITPVIDTGNLVPANAVNPSNKVIGGSLIATTPTFPGSLANSSPALPKNLDLTYVSSVILPGSPDVNSAIQQVIDCNCDCWIN